jgi:luciferase family oxidoreductase group 1
VSGAPLIENHPFRTIRAQPEGPTVPETWILGSSDYGAQVAAYFGLPYCFAYFITDGQGAEQALDVYRSTYRPSERWPAPHAALCLWALAADTQQEADYLFSSRALSRLNRDRGRYVALPSPEEAAAFPYTEPERAKLARIRERAVFGTPDVVARRISDLAASLALDEIAVLTTVHDRQARRRSYELIAREIARQGTAARVAAE